MVRRRPTDEIYMAPTGAYRPPNADCFTSDETGALRPERVAAVRPALVAVGESVSPPEGSWCLDIVRGGAAGSIATGAHGAKACSAFHVLIVSNGDVHSASATRQCLLLSADLSR